MSLRLSILAHDRPLTEFIVSWCYLILGIFPLLGLPNNKNPEICSSSPTGLTCKGNPISYMNISRPIYGHEQCLLWTLLHRHATLWLCSRTNIKVMRATPVTGAPHSRMSLLRSRMCAHYTTRELFVRMNAICNFTFQFGINQVCVFGIWNLAYCF